MTMVSTLPWRMQFRIIHQNEVRDREAAKSVVHPGIRNSDSGVQGGDRNRTIGRRLTISILGPVREAGVASVVVREVEVEGVGVVEVEAVAAEVVAASDPVKTSGWLHAADPDSRFQTKTTRRHKICESARAKVRLRRNIADESNWWFDYSLANFIIHNGCVLGCDG